MRRTTQVAHAVGAQAEGQRLQVRPGGCQRCVRRLSARQHQLQALSGQQLDLGGGLRDDRGSNRSVCMCGDMCHGPPPRPGQGRPPHLTCWALGTEASATSISGFRLAAAAWGVGYAAMLGRMAWNTSDTSFRPLPAPSAGVEGGGGPL